MTTTSRSSAWTAFINHIHNYNIGGDTLGNPPYHSGSYPWYTTGDNVGAYLGAYPSAPPGDLGLAEGSSMVASTFVSQYVSYAATYSRVRWTTHRRLYNSYGSYGVTDAVARLTALNTGWQTTAGMNEAAAPAGVAAGSLIQLTDTGGWVGVEGFAKRLASLIAALPGPTIDNYYCHSSCHSNVVKGRSRR